MRALYELRDILCDELDKIVSNGQNNNMPLDIVDKITHSLKSIETIIAMKEGSNNSYGNNSYGGNSYGNNSYNSYGRNNYGSYGRGYNMNYRSNRSYGDNKEEMMGELHQMMNEAKSEQERQAFQQFINQMQNM